MKKLIVIVFAAVLCSAALRVGPVILQRFDWGMVEARRLGPGELAYYLPGDGTAVIRVGDGESVYGMPVVDPASVRVAAQRPLSPFSDYYVEPFGGAVGNADGTFTIGAGAIAVTGGIRVVAQDVRTALSEVGYEVVNMGSGSMPPTSSAVSAPENLLTRSTNVVTITGYASGAEYVIISNIQAKAWVDRSAIGATNDFSKTTLFVAAAKDDASPTTLGQMAAWLANNEGRHWSMHKALRSIALDGFHLIWDYGRKWAMGHDADGSLLLSHNGDPVATFFEPSSTNAADAVKIFDFTFQTNVITMYVLTSLQPVKDLRVGSLTNLTLDVWRPYPVIYSSWSNTVERVVGSTTNDCYLVQVSSPDSSRFFRVFADLPGDVHPGLNVRSLKIDGQTIILNPDGSVSWE